MRTGGAHREQCLVNQVATSFSETEHEVVNIPDKRTRRSGPVAPVNRTGGPGKRAKAARVSADHLQQQETRVFGQAFEYL